jgi:hypothetical protein
MITVICIIVALVITLSREKIINFLDLDGSRAQKKSDLETASINFCMIQFESQFKTIVEHYKIDSWKKTIVTIQVNDFIYKSMKEKLNDAQYREGIRKIMRINLPQVTLD